MQKIRELFSDRKRLWTYAGRAFILALFLAGLCTIYRFLDQFVSNDASSWTRITFHDFYEAADEMDVVFVGSSHTMRYANAEKLSEDMGGEAFNLGTSSQDFMESYYTIREAISAKKVDHVIMGISISRLEITKPNETAVYIISDYIRSQANRIAFLTDAFESDRYINSFLRLRRNFDPQNVPSPATLAENYAAKQTDKYRNYQSGKVYRGRGQFNTNETLGDDTLAVYMDSASLDNFSAEDVQEWEFAYLGRTIDLCRKKGVKLSFLIDPYFEYYFMHFPDYGKITAMVCDLAAENGVDVIDLNRVKEEYLDLKDADFLNYDHVNIRGSEKIADFLAMYLKDPAGDYFYDTLAERYPDNGEILWAGYRRSYLTDQGEYQTKSSAEGTITNTKFVVSGISYRDIPTKARLCKVTEKKGEWIDGEEIPGEQLDDLHTQFLVPGRSLKHTYRLQLLDPETDEVLYETITQFDMA